MKHIIPIFFFLFSISLGSSLAQQFNSTPHIDQTDTLRINIADSNESYCDVILNGAEISSDEENQPVSVFPDPFTPNGDGYNDYAEFIFLESENLNPVIQIFNLRGMPIRELSDRTGEAYQWDGTDSDGNDVEPGVYIYIFTSKDNQASNGTITLIR